MLRHSRPDLKVATTTPYNAVTRLYPHDSMHNWKRTGGCHLIDGPGIVTCSEWEALAPGAPFSDDFILPGTHSTQYSVKKAVQSPFQSWLAAQSTDLCLVHVCEFKVQISVSEELLGNA